MKDTKTTKLIKRRIKELNNVSKQSDVKNLEDISDEISFLKGRLLHYKNVAKKYHRNT